MKGAFSIKPKEFIVFAIFTKKNTLDWIIGFKDKPITKELIMAIYRLLLFSFLVSCSVSIQNNERIKTPFKRTKLCVSEVQNDPSKSRIFDHDIDYIPDNIETCLGLNPELQDQDQNSVVDGIDSIYDPLFHKQWHLRSTGLIVNPSGVATIRGNDLGVIDLYHKYMGYNSKDQIIVQVVDDGVEVNHEDLNVNINIDLSRDSVEEKMGNPSPLFNDDSHGTMCAGIIAASGFNKLGVRGVAPFAQLAGNNWLKSQSITELEQVWLRNDPQGKIAIASNSWGSGDSTVDQDKILEDFMMVGTKTLRKYEGISRGKIFVKAAGNGRAQRANTALHYDDSNPYVFSVAALRFDNKFASYSTEGSNLLVTAYSGDSYENSPAIATTTLMGTSATLAEMIYSQDKGCYTKDGADYCTMPTWPEDESRNYTYGMSGTSAAAPMVAGALALVIEACPRIFWRDLKKLAAKHAKKIDPLNQSWGTNAAGFHHSTDYGFGLVNPKDMIKECQKETFASLPSEVIKEEDFPDLKVEIKDYKPVSHNFNVEADQIIEWIGLTLFSDHTYASDLEIKLTSPSGMTTTLIQSRNAGGSYNMKAGHRFGSLAFMGEKSRGQWTISIDDQVARDEGILQRIKIKIFGH